MIPFKTRWTLAIPAGIWMREATKKDEVRTAAFGMPSCFILRMPTVTPAAVTIAPAARIAGDRTPSETCIP
jgi:hypothetical protein